MSIFDQQYTICDRCSNTLIGTGEHTGSGPMVHLI